MANAALPVNRARGKSDGMNRITRNNRNAAPQSGKFVRLWGRHAVTAAMTNPARTIRKIWAVREVLAEMQLPPVIQVNPSGNGDLAALVPPGAPHQGIVAEVEPLDERWIDEFLDLPVDDRRPIIILDQVTDPQNVGAILRSAAAFDAHALITQDRHSPPESGVIARAASGALETMAWLRVVNLARALDQLAEGGFWRIGLDGRASNSLSSALGGNVRPALVMGAEGTGLRPNSAEHCDQLAKLPISRRMESLNVSNAAAIALYAAAEMRNI